MSHALLSPSASHRWIECPPSVRLTEFMEDKSSAYADKGSHTVLQRTNLNLISVTQTTSLSAKIPQ